MGFVETAFAIRGFLGDIPTFCSRCKQYEKLMFLHKEEDEEGDFTKHCGCGTTVFRIRPRDEGHSRDYYSKTFIPAGKFDKNYAKKTEAQKMGFEAIKQGNKMILVKAQQGIL